MNKLIIAIFIFLFTSIFETEAQVFSTYASWQETKENARLGNKQILLYFGASWSAYCKRLKEDVFRDSSVQALLEANFQCYEFEVDHENSMVFLKKYGITSYPLILILNNEGFLKAAMQSVPQEPSEFKQEVSSIAKSDFIFKGISNEIDLKYPKFYNDFYLSKQKHFPDSLTVTEYLRSQVDLFSEGNWNVLNLFNTNDEFFDFVLANRDRYKELYGSLEVSLKIQFMSNLFFTKYTATKDSVSYNRVIKQFLAKEGDSNYRSSLKSYYLKEIRFLAYTGMDWNKFISKSKSFIKQFGDRDESFILNYLKHSPNKNDSLYAVLPKILHSKSYPGIVF